MKQCIKCGMEKPNEEFHRSKKCKDGLSGTCKDCIRKYYFEHKDAILKKRKEWRNTHPHYMRDWQNKNKKRHFLNCKKYRERVRMKCLTYYGGNPPKCACCGETIIEFLSIDHINNDGAQQKRDNNLSHGISFFRWLIKNHFPKEYQVLCFNCNWGKWRNNGVCPHKKGE